MICFSLSFKYSEYSNILQVSELYPCSERVWTPDYNHSLTNIVKFIKFCFVIKTIVITFQRYKEIIYSCTRMRQNGLVPTSSLKSNVLVYTFTLMRYIPRRYKSLSIRDINLFSTVKYDDISYQISKYFQLWLVYMCCELSYDIDNLCIFTYF